MNATDSAAMSGVPVIPSGPLSGKMPVQTREQRVLIIVPTVFLFFATVAVTLRFYARHLKKARALADDYFCLLALILGYATHASVLSLVLGGGMGLHFWLLSTSTQWVLFKSILANYVLWVANVSALQISILFMYIRVFGIAQVFRRICYGVMFVVTGWTLAGIFTRIFACGYDKTHGIDKAIFFINPTLPGKCADEAGICESIGLLHVIVDFLVLSLPIPMIWKLMVALRTKIMLTILLTIGVFASICSVLRMECMISLIHGDPHDITGTIWQSILFQSLEVPVGIICICVPTFPVLGAKLSDSKLGSLMKSMLSSAGITSSGGSSGRKSDGSKEQTSKSSNFKRIEEPKSSKASQESQIALQDYPAH